MTLRECQCPVPEPKLNKPHVCVRCASSLDVDWVCNGKTLSEFMDRLEDSIPKLDRTNWQMFRLHVEAREAAGRSTFRQTFLGKDMGANGREEEADSCMYAFMRSLQRLREGKDQNWDLILKWAHHSYIAYETTIELHHREQGQSVGLVGDSSVHDTEQETVPA